MAATGTGKQEGGAKRRGFCLLLCLLLTLLPLRAEEARVRILHTSDLHANLSGGPGGPGGLLSLATLLEERRRQAPEGACLLVDTGDLVQGSLEGVLSRGMAMADWMNALAYDAWIPGNHDFDFGPQAFQDLCQALSNPLLCANLRPLAPEWPAPRHPQGWRIFTAGRARVALIGLTASFLPHWFPDFNDHFQVESAHAALVRLLPQVLSHAPDLVVVALHQGWMEQDPRGVNEVRELARHFPEVDLFLGGHTHRAFPGRAIGPAGRRPWYVQPAAHGEFFAQIDAVVDTESHRLLRLESQLVEIPPGTPPHPAAEAAVAHWRRQAAEYGEEVLALPLPRPLSPKGRPGIHCLQSELLCQALAEAAHCQVALHGVLGKEEIPAGVPLTGKILFQLVPYENSLVVCQVTPRELEAILEEQWAIRNTSGACGVWGAEARISPQGATLLAIGEDRPPVPDKRYSLVMNSHTAAGSGRTPVLGNILAQPDSQARDTGLSTRDALLQWFRNHPGTLPATREWLRKSP